MLRQGFRRCAGLVGSAASTSVVRSCATLPAARHGIALLSRNRIPLRSIAIVSRGYGTQAADAEVQSNEATSTTTAPTDAEEVTRFADLGELGVHNNLLNAIIDDMGYDVMTPVQAKTIKPALKGTDIVAQAKTGTGKTIAFLLPLLQRMIEEDPSLALRKASRAARSDDIRGIVLSPTRELAEQIATEAKRLVQKTGLVVQSAVGGTHKGGMLRQTQREGCHLLVATPGRLDDLLRDPASGIDAPNLAALVLDEADRMLDVGFEKELNDIIDRLPSRDEKVRQTVLVSATIPDNVIRLARAMVRPDDFEFVQTISENDTLTHDRVPQHIVPVTSWANVFPSLFEFIDREDAKRREDRSMKPFKAIVYFNTTALVELAGELGFQRRRANLMKLPTFSIQSQLSQVQRTRAADMFRKTRAGVLFSSDVTARGMDFPDVTHVIQVDTPRDRESYIHRLGRTGRQQKEGEGWLLVPPMSLTSARRLLRGLPLQPDKTLEGAEADIETGELPKYHQETLELIQSIGKKSILNNAYTSLFGGQKMHREELLDDLNMCTTRGWGLSMPPAVSSSWARNQGLPPSKLNIQDGRRDDAEGGDFGRGRRFSSGSRWSDDRRSGDRRSGERRSSDPFAEMSRQAHRDTPPRSGGSSRHFGRSRW
ncbi:ATP-dependent RNA helicase mss116 precursor [Drechmeria coniospora]|uniref:ATP-dependent RNA helicase n=1 Tax=Drechmeria coniospora TaxID=98403 RepID=A0A151GQA9_DRECN|nr:ATP-dependent RNA helicase mss116 precursor [Drechmeria coniospora]KYK59297.1 ATP-dependent RNA helicase mss116 precursor [Drechmeria coniospora]ODA78037.1 hypothetical protein RJ55_06640 [Drechmeria coniospora]